MYGRFPLSTPTHTLRPLVDLDKTPALLPYNHSALHESNSTIRLSEPPSPRPAHARVQYV